MSFVERVPNSSWVTQQLRWSKQLLAMSSWRNREILFFSAMENFQLPATTLWLHSLACVPASRSDQITRRWFTENISSWQHTYTVILCTNSRLAPRQPYSVKRVRTNPRFAPVITIDYHNTIVHCAHELFLDYTQLSPMPLLFFRDSDFNRLPGYNPVYFLIGFMYQYAFDWAPLTVAVLTVLSPTFIQRHSSSFYWKVSPCSYVINSYIYLRTSNIPEVCGIIFWCNTLEYSIWFLTSSQCKQIEVLQR